MGNGASTKEQQNIIKPITIFTLLENLLNQFESALKDLSNAQFTSIDELSKLEINETVEKLQNKINDELINLRSKIKQFQIKLNMIIKIRNFWFLVKNRKIFIFKRKKYLKVKLIILNNDNNNSIIMRKFNFGSVYKYKLNITYFVICLINIYTTKLI